ncbi:hypothetical protein [Phormidium tenue]|uniref:Uncharacterized protein n=1 Tax=Phormidium tenue NIES-30 TaxID=549789 RepID=A0A1U7IZQ0_9CYAN|nr:hypothetical protein [Phormidium tenue]MBD2234448.1 hypothetical protein [Phormidium tenue FACHB-1052]OKH44552.1 hypothetical protein NIES30_22310 [Phormidium tenue NIES-30]
MKNRCLPTCLILRNLCVILTLVAGGVLIAADVHSSANQQQQQTSALKQLFVYQILLSAEQNQE